MCVCACWTVHTVGGWMVRVALQGHFRGVQEPLVAHVAFTAAEEHVGTLLPLHTLVTAEDTEVEIRNKNSQISPLCSLQRTWEQFILFKCQWVHTHTRAEIIICMCTTHIWTSPSSPFPLWRRHERKTFIKYLLHTHANKHTLTITHSLSLSHSHSHQIKAKGSGSRPRLALDSPGRRGGAVWAEVPKLCGLQKLQQLYRSGIKENTSRTGSNRHLEPGWRTIIIISVCCSGFGRWIHFSMQFKFPLPGN